MCSDHWHVRDWCCHALWSLAIHTRTVWSLAFTSTQHLLLIMIQNDYDSSHSTQLHAYHTDRYPQKKTIPLPSFITLWQSPIPRHSRVSQVVRMQVTPPTMRPALPNVDLWLQHRDCLLRRVNNAAVATRFSVQLNLYQLYAMGYSGWGWSNGLAINIPKFKLV